MKMNQVVRNSSVTQEETAFSIKQKGLTKLIPMVIFLALLISFAMPNIGLVRVKADVTGEGTADNPYVVETCADLKTYLKLGYVKLGSDIQVDSSIRTDITSSLGEYSGGLDLAGHVLDFDGYNYGDYGGYFIYMNLPGSKFTLSDSNPDSTHTGTYSYTDPDGNPIKGGIICNFSVTYGGVLFTYDGEINITGGTMYNNKTTNSSANGSSVCVASSNKGKLNISNAKFYNNESGYYGICWIQGDSDSTVISDCIFKGNTSMFGGVISVTITDNTKDGNSKCISISDTVIENNSTTLYGAIYVTSYSSSSDPIDCYLKNVTISNNHCNADQSSSSSGVIGGMYFLPNYRLRLDGTVVISGNDAKVGSGSAYTANFGVPSNNPIEVICESDFDETNSSIGWTNLGYNISAGDERRVISSSSISGKYANIFKSDNSEKYTLRVDEEGIILDGPPKYFDVIFSMDNHGTAPDNQSVKKNDKVVRPTDPTAEGYDFGGWYKSYSCADGEKWDFDTDVVTQKTWLYAKWTPKTYTVTFDANGHGTAPDVQTIQHGYKVTKPTNPTVEGYQFIGWYKEAACTTAWNFSTNSVTEPVTLYAKWEIESYTVRFTTSGRATAPATQTITYNSKVTKPADPKATEYIFAGWYKEEECQNAWNFDSDVVTKETILYAKWKDLPKYTVAVTSSNGEWGTVSGGGEYKAGETVTVYATPGNDYEFAGWEIIAEDLTNLPSDLTTGETATFTMVSQPVTIRAKFIEGPDRWSKYVISNPDYVVNNEEWYGYFYADSAADLATYFYGDYYDSYHDYYYKYYQYMSLVLTDDIDLSASEHIWTPVHLDYARSIYGCGHKITLGEIESVEDEDEYYGLTYFNKALFYGDYSNIEIYDLTVEGDVDFQIPSDIADYDMIYVGGFAGKLQNIYLYNCTSKVNIKVTEEDKAENTMYYVYVGGMGAYASSEATLVNCVYEGTINSDCNSENAMPYIGDFCGYCESSANVINCADFGNTSNLFNGEYAYYWVLNSFVHNANGTIYIKDANNGYSDEERANLSGEKCASADNLLAKLRAGLRYFSEEYGDDYTTDESRNYSEYYKLYYWVNGSEGWPSLIDNLTGNCSGERGTDWDVLYSEVRNGTGKVDAGTRIYMDVYIPYYEPAGKGSRISNSNCLYICNFNTAVCNEYVDAGGYIYDEDDCQYLYKYYQIGDIITMEPSMINWQGSASTSGTWTLKKSSGWDSEIFWGSPFTYWEDNTLTMTECESCIKMGHFGKESFEASTAEQLATYFYGYKDYPDMKPSSTYSLVLAADIDLSDHVWTPATIETSFMAPGIYGQNHTISGMKVNRPLINDDSYYSVNFYAGLIGTASFCDIYDLNVEGSITLDEIDAFPYNYGSAYIYAGGIIGESVSCHIDNCASKVQIDIDLDNYYYSHSIMSGGIAGLARQGVCSIVNCTNYGDIAVESDCYDSCYGLYVGGLVGGAESEFIDNCVNFGDVTATARYCDYDIYDWVESDDVEFVGGIYGGIDGYCEVYNCYTDNSDGATYIRYAFSGYDEFTGDDIENCDAITGEECDTPQEMLALVREGFNKYPESWEESENLFGVGSNHMYGDDSERMFYWIIDSNVNSWPTLTNKITGNEIVGTRGTDWDYKYSEIKSLGSNKQYPVGSRIYMDVLPTMYEGLYEINNFYVESYDRAAYMGYFECNEGDYDECYDMDTTLYFQLNDILELKASYACYNDYYGSEAFIKTGNNWVFNLDNGYLDGIYGTISSGEGIGKIVETDPIIIKGENSWIREPAIEDIVYGNAVAAVYEAELGNDTVIINYEGIDGTAYTRSSTAPVEAGSYKATFTVADTTYYSGLLKEVTFKINKSNATIKTVPTANTLVYNGLAQALVKEGTADGGTIQYRLGIDGEYTDTIPLAINADTYAVYYKVLGDRNHNDLAETPIQVIMNPLDVTGATVGAFTAMTYTGDAQTPNANVTVNGLAATGKWSGVTNVTDLTTFTATGNFIGTLADKVTGMAKAFVTAPMIASKVYSGKLQTAEIPESELYSVATNVGGIEIGSYDVMLTLNDSVNYKWSDSETVVKTIKFVITEQAEHAIYGYSDTNGNTITADTQSAAKDTKITLSIMPAEEYSLQTISITSVSGASITLASDNTFVMPETDVFVNAIFAQNTYNITGYSDTTGNSVTADVQNAAKGTIITLTITSAEGYTFKSLTVTDAAGNVIPVNDNKFAMPAANVIIKSEFNKDRPAPTPDPEPIIIIVPQTQPTENSGNEDVSGTEETSGTDGTETEGSETGENADAEGAETAQETIGTNPITEKRDALVIDDLLSTDSNGEAATEADKEAITEAIVEAIETAIAESGTKDFVLKADEQTVTEQGIENKAYADAATEEITEITKPSETKSVTLESAVMEALANAEGVESLTVMTSVADVEFDAQTIESINEQSDGSVQLVVTLVKEEIALSAGESNKVYFEISLIKEDGTKITTFDGGSIKVTVPIPKACQNEPVVVVYTDSKGHYSPVNGVVNSDGTFTFITEHLSEYILMTKREAEEMYNSIYDFSTLKLHVEESTSDSITIDWNQYEDADGYIIYGNYCNHDGETYKVKKLATITDSSQTEYTIAGLEEGTNYKFRIKAFKLINGEKYVTVKSHYVHAVTLGGKQRVTADIKIDQTGMKKTNTVTLKEGQTYTIDAERLTDSGKAVHHVTMHYESSDASVATVSLRSGKITATGKGTCTVLAIAENGLYEEITVKVK